MILFASRATGAIATCALALALAGCNAQHSGELADGASANVAANLPAQAAPEPEAEPIAPGIPYPPMRPDFAKLAKEKGQEGQTQTAAAGSSPDSAGNDSGTTTVARSFAEVPAAQRPTGIFAVFAGAPADPAAPSPTQVASASTTASDASPAVRGSLNAYERRMSGDDAIATAPPAPAGGTSAFQVTPAAVVEVAGVTRELPRGATPALVSPSPRIAGTFGMAGAAWRPAYDDVVTNCFGPDLRAALENIARHFNSEVLVTSGHRTNGRRRSMHRTCQAADIRIVGVSPGTVARYASSVPGINGVGTYRRVAVTHIDTRENRMAWRY